MSVCVHACMQTWVPALPGDIPVRRGDFDRFWQFLANYSHCRNAIFLNTCSIEQHTILAHHVNILRSLLGWKYFILFFKDRTSLTSAAGVNLIGQYKHTNINLTTEMGPDWLICHVLKTYLSPTIIISYNDFGRDCALQCVYKYV